MLQIFPGSKQHIVIGHMLINRKISQSDSGLYVETMGILYFQIFKFSDAGTVNMAF